MKVSFYQGANIAGFKKGKDEVLDIQIRINSGKASTIDWIAG